MRKFMVVACLALGFLVAGLGVQTARADHGYGGRGYPVGGSCHQHSGYGVGYGGYGAGYGGYGYTNVYRVPVVPVYPTGVYQTYGYGVSPFNYGGYSSNYGLGYGTGYGVGYGGYNGYGGYGAGFGGVPRVQLRIGF